MNLQEVWAGLEKNLTGDTHVEVARLEAEIAMLTERLAMAKTRSDVRLKAKSRFDELAEGLAALKVPEALWVETLTRDICEKFPQAMVVATNEVIVPVVKITKAPAKKPAPTPKNIEAKILAAVNGSKQAIGQIAKTAGSSLNTTRRVLRKFEDEKKIVRAGTMAATTYVRADK